MQSGEEPGTAEAASMDVKGAHDTLSSSHGHSYKNDKVDQVDRSDMGDDEAGGANKYGADKHGTGGDGVGHGGSFDDMIYPPPPPWKRMERGGIIDISVRTG